MVVLASYAASGAGFEAVTNDPDSWEAQTFIIEAGDVMKSGSLFLARSGSPTSVDISIRAFDGGTGKPTGNDLATASLDISSLTAYTTYSWVNFTLSSEVNSGADTQFAIILKGGVGSGNTVYWKADKSPNSGVFTDGREWASSNGGSSWSIESESDAYFYIYGTPTSPVTYPTDAITRVTGITKMHVRTAGERHLYNMALQFGGLANLSGLEDAFDNIDSDNVSTFMQTLLPKGFGFRLPRDLPLPKPWEAPPIEPNPLRPGLPDRPWPGGADPTDGGDPWIPGGRREIPKFKGGDNFPKFGDTDGIRLPKRPKR